MFHSDSLVLHISHGSNKLLLQLINHGNGIKLKLCLLVSDPLTM